MPVEHGVGSSQQNSIVKAPPLTAPAATKVDVGQTS